MKSETTGSAYALLEAPACPNESRKHPEIWMKPPAHPIGLARYEAFMALEVMAPPQINHKYLSERRKKQRRRKKPHIFPLNLRT
jgi:hypothetical protein